jgi:hypothetical protein
MVSGSLDQTPASQQSAPLPTPLFGFPSQPHDDRQLGGVAFGPSAQRGLPPPQSFELCPEDPLNHLLYERRKTLRRKPFEFFALLPSNSRKA